MSPDEQKARDAEKSKSRAIDSGLRADQSSDQSKNKLLLLGTGECGKSTLFKQMVSLYGKGFSTEDLKEFEGLVYGNIMTTMRKLCEHTPRFGEVSCPNSRDYIMSLRDDTKIDLEVGEHLKKLWADEVTQEVFAKRHENKIILHSTDSIVYFLTERIDAIMQPDYIPTQQDHLRIRVPTTGIIKTSYDIDGNSFEMFDVGGQRSERKKWINCFDNVTAVLFVAAISEFDQILFEEANTNRIMEAWTLFGDIANCEYFERTSMILFLNKRDIFQEKIEKGIMLCKTFPEYTGPNTVADCTEFLSNLFAEQNNNPDKDVYTHITCATDTNNVFTVFSAVKDIIIKRGLMRAGLV
jgi:guanine nucleotide-binding protein G(i) subunit alpha